MCRGRRPRRSLVAKAARQRVLHGYFRNGCGRRTGLNRFQRMGLWISERPIKESAATGVPRIEIFTHSHYRPIYVQHAPFFRRVILCFVQPFESHSCVQPYTNRPTAAAVWLLQFPGNRSIRQKQRNDILSNLLFCSFVFISW